MQQAQLSDHNDVAERSRGRISGEGVKKILDGDSSVKVETLKIIAEATGTTATELIAEAEKAGLSEVADSVARDAGEARVVSLYHSLPPDQRPNAEAMLAGLVRLHSPGAEMVPFTRLKESKKGGKLEPRAASPGGRKVGEGK